jgi:succinyl-CoA synthetase alpha subunit
MSIILRRDTTVLVQGITGSGGRFHTKSMLDYGTRVVAGVSPGHRGEKVSGVSVYSSCFEAVADGPIDLAVCFTGGMHALEAVCEAVDSGIKTVVCIEELVPLWDTLLMTRYCRLRGTQLLGPNCNGIISPGEAKVGFFPQELSMLGPVGIISRSGTLTYGAMLALQNKGIGQSTVVGIGGARVKGTSFVQCLEAFASDSETKAVVLIGEIGGSDEESAAGRIAGGYPKPVVALVVGRVAPPGVAMGHAGAIVAGGRGGWQQKVDELSDAGVSVAANLDELADMVEALI